MNAPGARAFFARLRAGGASVELAAVGAFAAFFCLMAGYYALRPVRDLLGSEGGPRELAENFTCTFVVTAALTPLYAKAAARFDRRRFLRAAYAFLATALVAWALVFAAVDAAASPVLRRGFFVWISAYSLFLTSLFWSTLAEAFRPAEGRRFFGGVAAGATLGGMCGPSITGGFAAHGATKEAAAAWALLAAAALTIAGYALLARARGVAERARDPAAAPEAPPPAATGRAWDGFRLVRASPFLTLVAAYLALATLTGAFQYNAKAELARAAFADRAARLAALSEYEVLANFATLFAELVATPLLLAYGGARAALAVLPCVQAVASTAVGFAPTFAVVAGFDVLGRASRHGVATPARETLFTAVAPHEKYQAKAFIDTVVYRGGDVIAAWLYFAARRLADDGGGPVAGLSAVQFALAPCALLWLYVGARVAAAAPGGAGRPGRATIAA